jgi:Ni/Co efflux regulator RcnB
MRTLLALILAALFAGPAFAQGGWKKQQQDGRGQQMRQEDRQRMREDMRDVNRDRRGGDERFSRERPRQMSPEERDKLRRDVEDANKGLRR